MKNIGPNKTQTELLLCFSCLLCFPMLAFLCLLGLICLLVRFVCSLCFAYLARFHTISKAWLSWLYFSWLGLSSLGLIWLGRLVKLHALDFKPLWRKLHCKTAITFAVFEVEHDSSKKLLTAVILKLVSRRPNFNRF